MTSYCCSVAQSCQTLTPYGLQNTRLPRPLPSPRACSNLSIESVMPSNHLILCHPLLLLIFPNIKLFSSESVIASGGQIIGTSASASVFPMNIQDWSPLGLTGWISLQSKGLWKVFSNTTVQKHHFFDTLPFLWSNYHICTWLMEKP